MIKDENVWLWPSRKVVIFYDRDSITVKVATVRFVVHSPTVSRDWTFHQLDIRVLSTRGGYVMKEPPRYEQVKTSSYMCKLDKGLYGLKQALTAWQTSYQMTSWANSILYFWTPTLKL